MKCTCNILRPHDPALGLCDFCTEMLYAAELEQRLSSAERMLDEGAADNDRYVLQDSLETELETILKEKDYQDSQDVDSIVEQALKDQDMSDYVTKDELTSEMVATIEDSDIVKDAAAGAADAAMRRMTDYTDQFRDMTRAFEYMQRDVVTMSKLKDMSFMTRLRLLFGGSL